MTNDRYSRQSFIGDDSQRRISNCVVGIAGLGGGGSHIVQQLAHIGFQNYVLFDEDKVEWSNLNRLIGATERDAEFGTSKVEVAERLITGLQPLANVTVFQSRWQMNPEGLKHCDLVFGCVDGLDERDQLEAATRRLRIPLIDIGLDVHFNGDEPPLMGGQVFLSMPGQPCMQCVGMINEHALKLVRENYGDAGIHPQVVWANGMLASVAVGISVDLLTGWTREMNHPVYLEYRGNHNTMARHTKLQYVQFGQCKHYPIE